MVTKITKIINWEYIKTELQDKLNKVKSDKEMKEFCEDIFGGFIYANKDEIIKSIQEDETGMILKPHISDRGYIG